MNNELETLIEENVDKATLEQAAQEVQKPSDTAAQEAITLLDNNAEDVANDVANEDAAKEVAQEDTPQIPANLPKKFIDPNTGEVRLEALANSYKALERRLSQLSAAPQTDEDRQRLYRMLGQPESAMEYDVKLPCGLLDVDPDVNNRLHKLGCNHEQVQEVYNMASEKLIDAMNKMACEYQADREVEKLVAHFGGADKWHEVSRQLLAFGQNTLPDHVLDNLACSFEGVLALHRMMKSGIPSLPSARDDEDAKSYRADKKALDAMLQDPRYWKEKDPDFIAQVTEGFDRLYNNK